MFRGRSAWFSQSVSRELRDLWGEEGPERPVILGPFGAPPRGVTAPSTHRRRGWDRVAEIPAAMAEGGVISTHHGADYLFSSDASHPDTQRIHESLDYIEGKATVFHSCYLSANASASSEMKQTVALGHFILPPACVQEEIRKKLGSFIWEQMDDSLMEQLDELTPVEIKTSIKDDEQRIKGKKDLDGSSKEKRVSKTPVRGKLAFCPLQDYPVNNMVTGYVSSSEMKKYLGELHDFIPGSSGYSVYWVKNEMDVFSDVKNKLKRKL